MRDFDLYIFDLDGTLYRGSEPLPFAAEAVQRVRERGAQVRFLTNNSGSRPDQQIAKLTQMGIRATVDEILTSGIGAAKYLCAENLRKVFLVGEIGLAEILEDAGIELVSAGEPCDAVLVGICRTFTYRWMNEALQAILLGARFIATNRDATYPVENGRVTPGAGAIVASIETAAGQTPTVIGKPNPYLVQLLLNETGISPARTLVIGDRYETDILSAEAAGCETLLVLTGVTRTPPENQRWSNDLSILLEAE